MCHNRMPVLTWLNPSHWQIFYNFKICALEIVPLIPHNPFGSGSFAMVSEEVEGVVGPAVEAVPGISVGHEAVGPLLRLVENGHHWRGRIRPVLLVLPKSPLELFHSTRRVHILLGLSLETALQAGLLQGQLSGGEKERA